MKKGIDQSVILDCISELDLPKPLPNQGYSSTYIIILLA